MDALAGVTFRSADLLWLGAALPLVTIFLWVRERNRQQRANRFASERIRGVSNQIRSVRPIFLTAAFLASLIALAGPRYGFTLRTIPEPESNRFILLDASQSMAAEDVGMSRLEAGIAIAKRILNAEEGRVALIIFEGEAEVVSPLTSDRDAVITLLESFAPGELTEPGSDMGRALRRALELVPAGSAQVSEFVLISDGEHRGPDLTKALEEVKATGVTVTTVLVGTEDGSAIPTGGGRTLRDESGQTVITRAHPRTLRHIAESTGGEFFDNPFAMISLRRLTGVLSGVETGGSRTARVPVEQYQWPLAVALAMFVCGSIAHRGAEW